eukprot:TRINITY_DN957_c0_g1_i2.p1 TRINITY_DN957_c0_g1~~TRINITY_DN957_c0_g1_i2.p1  ORF type:complete len:153 (-),score=7.47 TRINITY_DN957_c0_g1_i2:154-612(-)
MCAMGVDGSQTLLSRMMIYSGHREMIYRAYTNDLQLELCTGIRKMDKSDVRKSKSEGWMAVWGTDFPRIDHEKYPQVTVGLGVLVPKQYWGGDFTEDSSNHVMRLKPQGNFLEYYVAAVWNKQRNGIASPDGMEEYMKNLSLRVNTPVQISY